MADSAPKPKNPLSTLVIVLAVVGVFLIMFDEQVRANLGETLGGVLDPVLGFNYAKPIFTLVIAGMFTVTVSTVVRHFFMDWVKMARTQETMRAFQKELGEARKANNTYKMKRLTELQPELFKMQSDLMGQQMKPMLFTMLVVIPIFLWLLHFMTEVQQRNPAALVVNVPWRSDFDLMSMWRGFIPRWILLYSLFSMPVGIVLQRLLKYVSFRKAAREAGFTGGAQS